MAPSWDGVAAAPLNFALVAIQTASAAHSELRRWGVARVPVHVYALIKCRVLTGRVLNIEFLLLAVCILSR